MSTKNIKNKPIFFVIKKLLINLRSRLGLIKSSGTNPIYKKKFPFKYSKNKQSKLSFLVFKNYVMFRNRITKRYRILKNLETYPLFFNKGPISPTKFFYLKGLLKKKKNRAKIIYSQQRRIMKKKHWLKIKKKKYRKFSMFIFLKNYKKIRFKQVLNKKMSNKINFLQDNFFIKSRFFLKKKWIVKFRYKNFVHSDFFVWKPSGYNVKKKSNRHLYKNRRDVRGYWLRRKYLSLAIKSFKFVSFSSKSRNLKLRSLQKYYYKINTYSKFKKEIKRFVKVRKFYNKMLEKYSDHILKKKKFFYVDLLSSNRNSSIGFSDWNHKLFLHRTLKSLGLNSRKLRRDLLKSKLVFKKAFDTFKDFLKINFKIRNLEKYSFIFCLSGDIIRAKKIFKYIVENQKGINFISIKDVTFLPHNGCRLSKKRRKKSRGRNKYIKKIKNC